MFQSDSTTNEAVLAKKDVQEFCDIHTSDCHPIVKKHRKGVHVLKWALKLLVPDYLIGHPNLFDNLKILRQHPQFTPLRHALVAWLLFSVTMLSTGAYALLSAPGADAANDFDVKTGYYQGTGTMLSISGLGFTPEMVIIKSDTAAGAVVWKSSVMPANVTAYLGAATADNTESQIMLNANGFSVSQALEVNAANVRYAYIAFAGSDCTAGGAMCIGSYTGNASTTQAVPTGFQPDVVWTKRTTAVAGTFRTSPMSANHAAFFSATLNDTTGTYFQTLDTTGFTAGATNNVNGGVYYFVAFHSLANKMSVGQFTGDGIDNRNITGLGFEPDFVLVKQNAALAPAFNTTETWGDLSFLTTAAASAVNHIQELQNDGFQVGNSTSVNALGVTSNWFAFGGAPDPAPSGSFFMQRGSYTGNGTTQSIDTSFAPDLVFVKGNTTEYGVWAISIVNNLTQYFGLSAVGFAGGVTTMGNSGFGIGSHPTVNTSGITYEWVAFGNATSPHTGDGSADFAIGSYTGTGLSPRAIDHLGFAPNMVVAKRPITTATVATWTSSAMAVNTGSHFSATADVTDGTAFRTLDSSGFTMGTAATVNTLNATYLWFGFKEGTQFDVGSYAGNGVIDTVVTGTGFMPDFLWTKRNTAVSGVHRSSSSTIAALASQHFLNLSNDTNDIKTFTANGFTVGNSAEVNTVGGTYQYAAWDSTTSTAAPNTPTNSAPSNGATGQGLNATLIGSTYVDFDTNAHTDTQWQIDNDANFSSPVWTRTAGTGEVTTSVTTANGAFTNELVGQTELDHASIYYWRVRYSDSVWSSWSSHTPFTTNVMPAPVNSSPANGATVTTLTPTLVSTAFSDPQTGHTALSAQWQIDTQGTFVSTVYDSGTAAYTSSLSVPAATLSDQYVYYWRVRHRDSSGKWSPYSTSTRFLVSKADVIIMPLLGSPVVDQGDIVRIDGQAKLADGTVLNAATVTIDIYEPSGTRVVDDAPMAYLAGSSGVYRYSYTVPTTSGSYLYELTATADGQTGYGAGNFETRTISADISDVQSTVNAEAVAQAAERTSQSSERSAQATERTNQAAERASQAAERAAEAAERTAEAAERLAQATSRTAVTDVQTKVTAVRDNMDILVGAMIVTQGAVNDASATTTGFVTSLINTTGNFYKNAVLTFSSGALDGQSRRISAYDGTTKAVVLDPALTSAPANGDAFTIVAQNVRVEEQVAAHETLEATERSAQAAFRTDTTARLADIESKIDAITTTVNTIDTNLDAAQTTVNAIRASQLKGYKVALSDVTAIQAGNTYRATLTVLDTESEPVDAAALPTIVLYDATRAIAQTATPMTKLSDGVYEFTFAVAPSAVTGLWEAIATVDVGGTALVKVNDYWQVTGAPAQVLITSISDITVPTITAQLNITNEGGGPFEYQYAWCVVSSETDPCGGGNDVHHATAAKLLNAGESWDTTLLANVPTPGSYWFKVVVYFGTESSGASQTFTAVSSVTPPAQSTSSGGGSYSPPVVPIVPSSSVTVGEVYDEMLRVRQQLAYDAAALSKTLELLGIMHPNILDLLKVSSANTERLTDLQNKVADLRAVSSATRRIVEQRTLAPIVETYMKFNSVEIHFLISNPDAQEQVIKFKSFLPEEVRPEHVIDASGLKVDYDTDAGVYYVSGDITLGPKETITRKVEMKDIWVFTKEEIASIKVQAAGLQPVVKGTQYEAQVAVLKGDIDATLNIVMLRQEESYSSPQDHIVVYRENKERVARAEQNLEKLKDLVVQAGNSRSVVGQVGGIQTFATWGIILAIIFGFGLLSVIIFALWRHQTMLAAVAMGMHEHEAVAMLGAEALPHASHEGAGPTTRDARVPVAVAPMERRQGSWKAVLSAGAVVAFSAAAAWAVVRYARPMETPNPTLPTVSSTEERAGEPPVAEKVVANVVVEDPVEKNPVEPIPQKTKKLKIGSTPTGWLRVRATPAADGREVGRVTTGTTFDLGIEKNGWYAVVTDDAEGWVSGQYVEVIEE